MKYAIIDRINAFDLQEDVQRAIKDGWTPIGGVSVVVIESDYGDKRKHWSWVQAVITSDDSAKDPNR